MTSIEIRNKIAELEKWLSIEDELTRKLDRIKEPVSEDICIDFYRPEATRSGAVTNRFIFSDDIVFVTAIHDLCKGWLQNKLSYVRSQIKLVRKQLAAD